MSSTLPETVVVLRVVRAVIGINSQAILQWSPALLARLTDRVQAALWRMQKPEGNSGTQTLAQPSIQSQEEGND